MNSHCGLSSPGKGGYAFLFTGSTLLKYLIRLDELLLLVTYNNIHYEIKFEILC